MNEKKFVVVRNSSSSTLKDYSVFVSDIYGNNGFSSQIEDAMTFDEFQADTVRKALETIEKIHDRNFREIGVKVFYSIEEVVK